MTRSLNFFLTAALLLMAACSTQDKSEHLALEDLSLSLALDTTAACPNWRWVGISAGDSCPEPTPVGGANLWKTHRLFPAHLGGIASPLDSFCLYEHAERGNTLDIPALVRDGLLERADPDCAVVAGNADFSLAEALAPTLEKHFTTQVGQTPIPIGDTYVRLAFLDTERTAEDGTFHVGASAHGSTLIHLARSLLCADGDPCAAQITAQLALPILDFGPTAEETQIGQRGGYFGTFAQLATALRHETMSWQAAETTGHLILNLSVAWNGQRFGGLEEQVQDMAAPIQAVYRALEDATCRGALVVAAAGNRNGGPDAGSGALLPAAWETRRAPNAEACAHLPGLDPSLFAPPEALDPLVHAVSAVDSSGAPLVNVRPGAIPRLAAYGDHAVTWIASKQSFTGTYTGSSVAAAVVSSTAAAVWHHRGALRRDELMNLLYLSGDPLDRPALLFPGGQENPPEVHRISLCGALRQACQGGSCQGMSLDQVPTCSTWAKQAPFLSPTVDNFLAQVSPPTLDASLLTASAAAVATCTTAVHFYDPQNQPPTFCPADEQYGIKDHPWTGPQPDDIPCPSCPLHQGSEGLMSLGSCNGVVAPYSLAIEISPTYGGGDLTAATLEIGDTSYSLPEVPPNGLQPGDHLQIDCIDGTAIQASAQVSLSFLASQHGAVANPVIVVN